MPNKLWLTVGSKFEHNVYTGWETEPGARLLWTPTSHQTLWSAVTRAVRTPSRIDEDMQLTGLVPTNPPLFFCICDNHKFASETLLGYEAGYRKLITHNFYVDIAACFESCTSSSTFFFQKRGACPAKTVSRSLGSLVTHCREILPSEGSPRRCIVSVSGDDSKIIDSKKICNR